MAILGQAYIITVDASGHGLKNNAQLAVETYCWLNGFPSSSITVSIRHWQGYISKGSWKGLGIFAAPVREPGGHTNELAHKIPRLNSVVFEIWSDHQDQGIYNSGGPDLIDRRRTLIRVH